MMNRTTERYLMLRYILGAISYYSFIIIYFQPQLLGMCWRQTNY